MPNKNNIFSHSFLLVSHYATYAMQDLLFEYLTKHKSNDVTKINFPLPELGFLKQIQYTDNQKGNNVRSFTAKTIYKGVYAYPLHFFQCLYLVMRYGKVYDVAIAQDGLLAWSCLLLRRLGRCKKVVFYSHGVDEQRFGNKLVNLFYKKINETAAKRADANWTLGKAMKKRREQQLPHQTIHLVPAVFDLSVVKQQRIKPNSLIFIGTFNEMNGVLLLPEIVHILKKSIPNIHLDIIGDGVLKDKLFVLTKKLKLEKNIKFLGIQRSEDYLPTLSKYSIALAPYKPSKDNLLLTTDPMKIRIYTVAGVPIVLTRGFWFSDEVTNNKLGDDASFSSDDFAQKIIVLLKNKKKLASYRHNALEYRENFNQEKVYQKIFQDIFYE